MAIRELPVDQRVIEIDVRSFSSVEKALVELITNADDSYTNLERGGSPVSGRIEIAYERHHNTTKVTVLDEAEGMSIDVLHKILTYGGAQSALAQKSGKGRGFFGRGLKQAIFGLGHGSVETIHQGRYARVDCFRDQNRRFVYEDHGGDREALEADWANMGLALNTHGTRVTVWVENPQVNIPLFSSLVAAIRNNIYLRDVLRRRTVAMVSSQRGRVQSRQEPVRFEEPEAEMLLGPDAPGEFVFEGRRYPFTITLKRALQENLILKGDERTSGLLVKSGFAILDCQFFLYENQTGTEYLYGTVVCDALTDMLAQGIPVVSDERNGLNIKHPFVAAFSNAVSAAIAEFVRAEQDRMTHIERATTSNRTKAIISDLLQRMNRVAIEELALGIVSGPGSGLPGGFDTGRNAVLRFTMPTYYREPGQHFHATLLVDLAQLDSTEQLSITYDLPEGITLVEGSVEVLASDLLARGDGRVMIKLVGVQEGVRGAVNATLGSYSAHCDIVIEHHAPGYTHAHSHLRQVDEQDNSLNIFVGYELRNRNNELERAIYIPEERLIIINTGAPTVRMYVDGRGQFKDAARLLLAELFMDVITEELARRYVNRSTRRGDIEAFRAAKQDFVRRYGADIHRAFLG